MMTFEVIGSTKDERDWLTGRIGLLVTSWERLDYETWNVTVPDSPENDEIICDWADRNKYGCRLV